MATTPFSLVYDLFLSKVTDDLYLELTELDTYRLLQDLLLSAISKFEFPRKPLDDYNLQDVIDVGTYNGVESNSEDWELLIYGQGQFNVLLTDEEMNILATYMIVEWIGQQLASIENTRMKYWGRISNSQARPIICRSWLQLKKSMSAKAFISKDCISAERKTKMEYLVLLSA